MIRYTKLFIVIIIFLSSSNLMASEGDKILCFRGSYLEGNNTAALIGGLIAVYSISDYIRFGGGFDSGYDFTKRGVISDGYILFDYILDAFEWIPYLRGMAGITWPVHKILDPFIGVGIGLQYRPFPYFSTGLLWVFRLEGSRFNNTLYEGGLTFSYYFF